MEVCVSVAAGKKCVAMVAEICQQLGYSVYVPEKETGLPWDIKVNGLKVQVKLRELTPHQNRSRILLKTYMACTRVSYKRDDFDVLVALHCGRWFIAPFDAIAHEEGCLRNRVSLRVLGEWADRWDVLDGQRVAYSQQKVFDF